jgi:SAM-dependent methyltransferase
MPDRTVSLPSLADLERLFIQKYGTAEKAGWSPRRRMKFGYFPPADIYEATVSKVVQQGDRWLDVGGGHSLFPENPRLANTLVQRCASVTAVDPSENVLRNQFAQHRIQSLLEDYHPADRFDIVTMRMVVEHVERPDLFGESLGRIVRPGGVAVVFTVNRLSPVSILANLVPFRFHHAVKSWFWGGDEVDTFPVHYKLNSRRALDAMFERYGFQNVAFSKLDDLATFSQFRFLGLVEMCAWKTLLTVGVRYPENCLLAVYQRASD